MFRKPFNVKKSTSLKSSDARKLLTRALGDSAGTDAFAEYKKALISQTTVTLFNDVTAVIYSIQKAPLFYEYEDEKLLYPSVFFLWRHPHFLPAVFIHEQVFRYLENGADLMAPGIASNMILSEFVPGQIVAIWIFHSGEARGPVAVGKALLSSAEIQTGRALGKAVAVVHWHKDLLWSFGEKGDPPTKTVEDLVKEFTAMSIEEKEEEPQPRAETESKEEGESSIAVDDKPEMNEKNEDEDGETEEQTAESEAPEQLLQRCFIAALKFRVGKSTTLPLDVGQFYSQFLLPTVPNGRRLDIKKTPHKKFSVFLEHINKHEGGPILKIKKGKKGDDAIDEIFWSHPLIRSFEPTDEKLKDEEQPAGKKQAVSITQYVSVTDAVLSIFKTAAPDISKGDLLSTADARELIREYVRKENLTSDKKVKLDPLLANVTKSYETEMDWNKLIQSIQSKMTPAFVIRTPDGKEIVRKIKMPHIEFKVETRSGNKKVTLINNLTPFGIDIKTICNQIKIGVSTSATVNNEAVNCEGPQVIVQGNQIHFIGDLLKNEYQIDPKYMVGLNLAVKKKK